MNLQSETAAPVQGKATAPKCEGISTPNRRQFQPETLAQLRARLPDYLEACGVELRRNGTRLVGRCPMHEDRSPSFAVFGQRNEMAGCYPCQFTGDVFKVAEWMGRAGSFPDAVRHVAATLGVYLPDAGQSPPQAATRPAIAKPRPKPEPPQLSPEQAERIHAARLRFSDALHAGEPIIAEIARGGGR